jgi:small subunit ribosomal protein S20
VAKHKSAEKRNRQNQVRKTRNAAVRSRMRRAVKLARAAIAEGAANKGELFKNALLEVQRAASKKVLKKETASRYVSRLSRAMIA